MSKETLDTAQSEVLGCNCPPRPAPMPPYSGDVFAFASYKKIAADYDSAVKIVYNKRLQLGEPVVVPYLRNNKAEMLFAIGSQSDPMLIDSANTEVADALVQDPITGDVLPLHEVLENIAKAGGSGEGTLEDLIEEILTNEESANALAAAIAQTQVFVDLTQRVQELEDAFVETTEKLGWKSWE